MSYSNFKEKSICIPFLVYLIIFVFIPFVIVFFYSFIDENGHFTLYSIINFFTNLSKCSVLLKSLFVATQTTLICLLLSYPLAYFLAKKKIENIFVISLFAVPMAINFILKAATIRDLLLLIGITGGQYPYLSTIIGMVYNFLPFAVFPIYNVFLKLDQAQLEAASDLGATPKTVFLSNIIPQTTPGIMSAILMVFMPAVSSYVMYDVFSEGKIISIGGVICLSFLNNQWNIGCFLSCIMLLAIVLMSYFTNNLNKKN
ncbi:MAG: ABC transporter permease [Bacilli bacterium]|nr:ABC transporter permease [Bacilli bacterium]